MTKVCWKCKVEQPIEAFARNRSKSSGRAAECKSCVRAYNKVHVAARADYYNQYRSAKRKQNVAWYLFLECRTRAKRNGLEFNLEPQDIQVPTHCPVFGFELRPSKGKIGRDQSASVDRIDSSLGYVKGNVRVISYLANRMKSNATAGQLKQFAHWILEIDHGSTRGVDPRQSASAHSDQYARAALDGSCTWQAGPEQVPGDGHSDSLAQVAPGSQRH